MTWTTRLPEAFIADKPPPYKPVFEDENALKLAFAAALLKSPDDPYRAACSIIDTSQDLKPAMYIANNWQWDSVVRNEQARLIQEQGELAFLPSKAKIAREIYELSTQERLTASDKIKLEAAVAYAKLMGYMPQETAKSNVNVNAGKGAAVQVVASELDEKL